LKRVPLKRKPPSNPIPDDVREAVYRRSGGWCEFDACLKRAAHLHHRLPRSAGGKHTVDNLVDLCGAHHAWIHSHPVDAYALGWLERRT
jgi:5-methylcytosine-specific restriction endonuclease McrA